MANSSYISVDIDVDDIISSISTKDLLAELQSRNETAAEYDGIGESLKEFIESSTNRIIESFTDDELVHWVLSNLGRE